MISPEERKSLEKYLKQQQQIAGRQRIGGLDTMRKYGMSKEQIEAVSQSPKPVKAKPRGIGKVLESVFRPIGFYVRHTVPGFVEWLSSPLLDSSLRSRYGDSVADTYRDEREKQALEQSKRIQERGGGLEGWASSLGDFFRSMSSVREKRPGLFMGEKLISELLFDPTTYMGFGLASKVPLAGRVLGPILDVLPNRAWWYAFGLPAKTIRKGLEAMPIEQISTTLLLGLHPTKKAALEADKVVGGFGHLFGQAAINADKVESTRAVLDTLTKLIGSGVELSDENIEAALRGLNNARLFHQGAATKEALKQARLALGGIEGLQELAISKETKFKGVPEHLSDDWLDVLSEMRPSEFLSKMRGYSEDTTLALYDRAVAEASANSEGIAALLVKAQNSKFASLWSNKIMRWAVMEPARAILVFANYGAFNYVEDFGFSILGGVRPIHTDLLIFNATARNRALPKMFEESLGLTEAALSVGMKGQVPALVRFTGPQQVAEVTSFVNRAALKASGALRRGVLLEKYKDAMLKGFVSKVGFFERAVDATPSKLKEGYDLLHTRFPQHLDKELGKSAKTFAKLAFLQGDSETLRGGVPTVFNRLNLDKSLINEHLRKEMSSASPELRKIALDHAVEFGHAGFVGEPFESLRQKMLSGMVEQTKVEPKVIGEKMNTLLRVAKDLAERGEDATSALDAIHDSVRYLGTWSQYANTISERAAKVPRLHKPETWGWWSQKQNEITEIVNSQMSELRSIVRKAQERLGATTPGSKATIDAFAVDTNKALDDFATVFAQLRTENADIFERYFQKKPLGLDRLWGPTAEAIVKGDKAAKASLPREWQRVLDEGGWLSKRLGEVSTDKERRELAHEIVRQGWFAFQNERNRVGAGYRAGIDLKEILGRLDGHIKTVEKSFISPEAAALRETLESTIDEASGALSTVKDVMDTNVFKLLEVETDTALEGLERVLRAGSLSEDQAKALQGYFDMLANKLDEMSPEDMGRVIQNSEEAWEESLEWFRDTFTNYDHMTMFDDLMRTVNPFWVYQSRSWPRVLGMFVKRPLVATSMAPGGRFWTETDEGYVSSPLPGFEFSPIRGTVLGRLRRAWRGTFPPRYSGMLGRFENIEQTMEQYGFFPGIHITIPTEAVLGLFGGGSSRDVLGTIVEALPAPMATVADGMIAASRVLGPSVTTTLADSIFPSKFRDYYAAKSLWDSHKVSLSQAQEMGREDWLADAFAKVALGQMLEEQVALTRFNPESWQEIKSKLAKVTEEITGISPEEQEKITRAGNRLSDIVPMSRIDRAKLGLVEGIVALSEAGTLLSPEDRRLYMEALHDFYGGLESIRKANYDEQLSDDSRLTAGELDPKVWRENYSDRMAEYRTLADNSAEFRYFGKVGKTPIERQAIRERYGLAPKFVHPVDVMLDAIFAMEPAVDSNGEADYLGLFTAQDELIGFLPAENQKEIRDFLMRSATPLVREFREGRLFMKPYWQAEKEVPKWYRSLGYEDTASTFESAARERRRLEAEEQEQFAKGIAPTTTGRSLSIEGYLRRHIAEYRWRLVYDSSMPGYDPRITEYIRKFYGQKGP